LTEFGSQWVSGSCPDRIDYFDYFEKKVLFIYFCSLFWDWICLERTPWLIV